MGRVKDYSGFAVWFLAFAYSAAWVLVFQDAGLPLSLHLLGLAAVSALPVVLWRVWHSPPRVTSYGYPRPPERKAPPVRRRAQFGLRGQPRDVA